MLTDSVQIKPIDSLKTIGQKIAAALREEIVAGTITPGERLQEVEIAEKYGASRTPVREALRQLENEGFISLRPRRGAIVSEISADDISDFYELNGLLESYAAKRAAYKLTQSDIEKLEVIVRELQSSLAESNHVRMYELFKEYRDLFVSSCGNERLSFIVQNFATQFKRFNLALSHTDAAAESIELHQEMTTAFASREPDKAAFIAAKLAGSGASALLKKMYNKGSSDVCK